MGIKSLNSLLKKKAPNCSGEYFLSTWRGKRIAIDANNWFYTSMAVSHSHNVKATDVTYQEIDNEKTFTIWLNRHLKYFIFRFLECGVTPVFIFDGGPPVQKDGTLMTRRDNKEITLEQINKKRKEMNTLSSQEDIEELKKLYRKQIPLADGEMESFKCILSAMGIPYIDANFEAEEAATILCIEGIVAAVFSADYDTLARGCPVMIRSFEGRKVNPYTRRNEPQVDAVILNSVLSQLSLTYAQFLDFCIMCGCDYNTNIPRIGVMTSYDLILNYKSIDNLPPQFDKTPLAHVKCREMFACKPVSTISDIDLLNLQIDKEGLETFGREILASYGVSDWITDLIQVYKDFPLATDSMKCNPHNEVKKNEGPIIKIITPETISPAQMQLNYLASSSSTSTSANIKIIE